MNIRWPHVRKYLAKFVSLVLFLNAKDNRLSEFIDNLCRVIQFDTELSGVRSSVFCGKSAM